MYVHACVNTRLCARASFSIVCYTRRDIVVSCVHTGYIDGETRFFRTASQAVFDATRPKDVYRNTIVQTAHLGYDVDIEPRE